jgi:hypothetical protein
MEGIRHFRYILEGWAFTILTDHKPLVGALARTLDPWTARQCRHLAYVAGFTSDIQHLAGRDNIVADALSRPPMASLVPPLPPASVISDLQSLASHQRGCVDTQQACKSSSLRVRDYELHGVKLLCGFTTGRLRPLVPREDRWQVFEAIHGRAHPGIRASKRLFLARYVWPRMKTDIAAWCWDCVAARELRLPNSLGPRCNPSPFQHGVSSMFMWT